MVIALVTVAMTATALPVSAAAQSQNELLVNINWDGQAQAADSAFPGSACTLPVTPTGHTAGLDDTNCNGVVRTFDLVQYRVDYNVNEAGQTGVGMTLTLPPNMTWVPSGATISPTYPNGMFPGCLANSTITSSGTPGPFGTVGTNDILFCDLDAADNEGNNGTIYPTAQLLNELDGQSLTMSAVLATNEDPTGVSGSTDIVASAKPAANFRKGIIEVEDGTILGYYAETEYEDVVGPDGSTLGRAFLWPIDFRVVGGLLGSAPLDDTQDIVFYDHAYGITPSAQLASSDGTENGATLLPDGRTACGTYDGSGKYPIAGTWVCEIDAALTASYGYPVIKITLVGGSWSATTLTSPHANGATNTDIYATGQIAFWAPETEVEAKSPTIMFNSISNESAQITDTAQVTPIDYWALATTGSYLQPETTADDNDAISPYENDSQTSSNPGVRFQHDVSIYPAPLELWRFKQNLDAHYGLSYTRADFRPTERGGQRHQQVCGVSTAQARSRYAFGECQLSRGQVVTIMGSWATLQSLVGDPFQAYINGCIAIDNTHLEVVAVPAAIAVEEGDIRYPGTTLSSYTVAPSHNIAHLVNGVAHLSIIDPNEVSEDYGPGGNYVVEVATAAPGYFAGVSQPITPGANPTPSTITAPYSIDEDEVHCNNDAAAGAWVDVTSDMSSFDSDGNGTYDLINLARVRSLDPVKFSASDVVGEYFNGVQVTRGAAFALYLGAQVKTDIYEQSAGQEIFVAASRNWSNDLWDPSAGPATIPAPDAGSTFVSTPYGAARADCMSISNGTGGPFPWEDQDNTSTGWCNKKFNEFTTAPSPGASGGVIAYDQNALEDTAGSRGYTPHVDKAYIVEANIAVNKTNLSANGDSQIIDNGDTTSFGINVATVGSTLDEVLNLELTDTLPANLAFTGFTVLPAAGPDNVTGIAGDANPGVTPSCVHTGGTMVNDPTSTANPPSQIAAGGTITCDFGDRFGGWSDYVEFGVMVVQAAANIRITNTAKFEGDRCSGVDPVSGLCVAAGDSLSKSNSAALNTPGPFQEAAIIKTVDTFEGDCTDYPAAPIDAASLPAQPAFWADVCEMVTFESAPGNNTTEMGFVLEMSNEGNTPLTNVRMVDVFSHVDDEAEPPSATGIAGDGRTPETDTTGTLSLVSLTGDVQNFYVTGDAPGSISRDPNATALNNTWCTPAGAFAFGVAGACPAAGAETAIFAEMDDIAVGQSVAATLVLESVGHECDDIWTNTFGARNAQTLLPIRSNDVSIMVECEFDLALRKTVDPAWTPGADWLTPGASTVDFVIEVHNQGHPVNNFEVTDYVDPAMFTFAIADNAGANTLDALGLPYTWDASGLNPVVTINDPAHPLHDPNANLIPIGSVLEIPVTLTVAASYVAPGALSNTAEISYFDNDGDAANGDSASGDVLDVDSLADGSDGDALVDDEINDSIAAGGTDEDDHDIALVPVYDVELDKSNPVVTQVGTDWQISYDITVLNNSNTDVFNVDVVETDPAGLAYNSSVGTGVGVSTAGGDSVDVVGTHPNYVISTLNAGDLVTITVVYDVTDLTAGPYVNSAEIAVFEDADGNTPPDTDSTPGNDTDPAASNEDDDDVEEASLPFDLALVKKLSVSDPAFTDIADGLQDGDLILFNIEVFNQLGAIEDFDVIDYVQPGFIFDPAVQVSPLFTQPGTNGGPALPFTWSASGADPIAVVDGVLGSGESVIIPIVLIADIANSSATVLENIAEIIRFDDDGDPSNGDSSDGSIIDIDSSPDGSNDDDLIDDALGGTGDEDDHDVAQTVWYDVAIDKQIFDGTACVDGPAQLTAATTAVSYCLTVTNEGPTPLFNVNFADTPPAGLTFTATTVLGGATDLGGGAYEIASLPAGASETVQLEYALSVPDVVDPSLMNVVEVTAMFADAAGTDPAEDVDSFADPTADNDEPVEDDESAEFAQIPFDLALTKTFGSIDGDEVTMFLTVENQSIAVATIDIVDYIDPAMWQPFSAGLNPAGAVDAASTAPAAFGFFWDTTDPLNPVATIAPSVSGDLLGFGETVVIPVVLTMSPDWVGPELSNTAEISNFDNDEDPTSGDAADGTLAEADSQPDDTNGNGPGESFNSSDDETGEDPAAGGDEDDHDSVAVPVFDLALTKTLDPATPSPVTAGDLVTFSLEIANQGSVDALDPTLIDYLDPAFWGPFNPGDNAPGASADPLGLAYTWTAAGTDGALAIAGVIPAGDSIIVPVTLRVSFAPTATVLTNHAEITSATPVDENGDPVVDENGDPIEDVDSTPDDTNDGENEDDFSSADVIVAVGAIDIEKVTNGVQSDTPVGEQIAAGDPITWSYVVTNTGTAALVDVVVDDSDPALNVDCGLFSNTIALLLPGASVTCEATGTAEVGAYANTADVSGTPSWPTDPTADPTDPGSWSENSDDYAPTGQDDVTDNDDSHYFGTDGGIELEKSTNTVDADDAPGPLVALGDPITWTYEITNTSPVAMIDVTVADSDPAAVVICPVSGNDTIALLLPGEVVTCTATGVAGDGQYRNDATVTGTSALPDLTDPSIDPGDPTTWPTDPADYTDSGEPPYGDEDSSHYVTFSGEVTIEKATNGADSDVAPGQIVTPGDPVTWIYVVTNASTMAVVNVLVTDSDPAVTPDCGNGSNLIDVLQPTESQTCTATGVAIEGGYTNNSIASATPATEDPDNPGSYDPVDGADPITAEDPSNYTGAEPAIDIEKDTNGVQSDTGIGEFVAAGDPVTWTYEVTNTGPVPLANATVTDSDPAISVDCGGGSNVIALLLPTQSASCSATGNAALGLYTNTADVTGDPVWPVNPTNGCCDPTDPATWPTTPSDFADTGQDPVSDTDDSAYHSHDGSVLLEKLTNGSDSDMAPGQAVSPGDAITWSYLVVNTSTTPLVDLVVTDDDPTVTVDCGNGSNTITSLIAGGSHTCTATGTAVAGGYTNTGSVTGAPGSDNGDGTFSPIDNAEPVTDEDDSNYIGAEPAIDIEKDTNGAQSDTGIGEPIHEGDAVIWTYDVTNTGDTPLANVTVTDSDPAIVVDCGTGTNTVAMLLPGATVACTAEGVAELGLYSNTADVTGDPVWPTNPTDGCCDPDAPASWPTNPEDFGDTGQDPVTDTDDSAYFSHDGDVLIEKATNGADADTAPGTFAGVGDAVTWTYEVTNTSATPLVNLVVTDDQGEFVDCTGNGSNIIAVLLPGETAQCTATGIAQAGQYTNLGSVIGTPGAEDPDFPGGFIPIEGADPVSDDDPSNVFAADPSIAFEKSTNGVDADTGIGERIAIGDTVTWTYEVTNDGEVALAPVTVTDNDPAVNVDCGDGTNVIALLVPTERATCTATGTAVDGLYENMGTVTGDPVSPIDPADDCCDPTDASTWPTNPADFEDTGQDPVNADDPSHYHAYDGSIDLEKSTNGNDSDIAPGQIINPGEPVTWTYSVTNDGVSTLVDVVVADNDPAVAIDCGSGTNEIAVLAPGVTHTCSASGIAGVGEYTNTGSVAGTPGAEDPETPGTFMPIDGAEPATDEDDSNYTGIEAGISLDKDTNGADSDTGIGEFITPGALVTWTYEVTNTGEIPLANIVVTDDDSSLTVDCGDGTNQLAMLLPGEAVTCTASGVAGLGFYTNTATVTSDPVWPANPTPGCCDPDDPSSWPTDASDYGSTPAVATDSSSYHSHDGDVMIEKFTNGADADVAPGQAITPGDAVTWTYVVVNTSATPLVNLLVADNDPAALVDCGDGNNTIALLIPGATQTCTATGTAIDGAYSNIGSVSGVPGAADPENPGSYIPIDGAAAVSDDDPSNYSGAEPAIDIEKDTNGNQSDKGIGELIAAGAPVTWTYEVTNTGDTPLANVVVNDSDPTITVDCGDGTNVFALLLPGQNETCSATGIAVLGLYTNTADATGNPVWPTNPTDGCCNAGDPASWPTNPADFGDTGQEPVSDTDDSAYHSHDGDVLIEKLTNGDDSDVAPGQAIVPGDPVTWSYLVSNTSTTHLVNLIVTDNDPAVTVDCGDGTDQIAVLAPGVTATCTASGMASAGAYNNVGSVTGTPGAEDPDNLGSFLPIDGAEPVNNDDESNYIGVEPAIDLEKATNGVQSDTGIGELVPVGDTVTWTYEVTNTGGMPLANITVVDDDPTIVVDCGDGSAQLALLLPGATVTCTATGIAGLGTYTNTANVTGDPVWPTSPTDGCCDPDNPASWSSNPDDYGTTGSDPVQDEDVSAYHSHDGDIMLEKSTNGEDADSAPGVFVTPGGEVVWTYAVTNTSATPIVDLVVTDDQGEFVDCGDGTNTIAVLMPGATTECTASGVAASGQYSNIGAVTGTPGIEDSDNPGEFTAIDGATPVNDNDASNMFGAAPAIDLEKATNGADADTGSGPVLTPGDLVTWTYDVTNTGDVPLTGVTVNDNDQTIAIDCGDSSNQIELLLPTQIVTCTASGVAALGEYENVATVTGTPAIPAAPVDGCCDPADPTTWPADPAGYTPTGQDDPADTDMSHYVAHDGDVLIQKDTNGADADEVPGPILAVGDAVEWRYVVTNTSSTALVDLVVTDDQGEPVDCGLGTNLIPLLLPGETEVCAASSTVSNGQYTNVGSVQGTPATDNGDGTYTAIDGAEPATDDDPSNYLGGEPALGMEKSTNGVDADTAAAGEEILEGDPIVWTYEVTNTGDLPMVDIEVDDSQGVTVDCGDGTSAIAILMPGDTITCTGDGVAGTQAYNNTGVVTGSAAFEDPANPGSFLPHPDHPTLTDIDLSHYTGVEQILDLALVKKVLPAPASEPKRTFTLEVFNQGTVSATDIVVTDFFGYEGNFIVEDEDWTDNGDDSYSYTIVGPLAPGESILIEIDVRAVRGGTHDNIAGITGANAAHPETGAPLPDLVDIDSTGGDPSDHIMVDDEVDGASSDNDESDLAPITFTPPETLLDTGLPQIPGGYGNNNNSSFGNPPSNLAFARDRGLAYTGSSSQQLALFATLMIVAGAALVLGATRRRKNGDNDLSD